VPRIKQYVSQESSSGRAANISRVGSLPVDASGLVRGIADFASVREKAIADLKRVQEIERQKLEHDESVMHVTNAVSEATIQWQERLQQKQQEAPANAAGFTESTLKDFDTWTNEKLNAAPTEQAKKLLAQRLEHMKVGLHADAFKFEIQQRNKALLTDFQSGLDADRRAVIANPGLFAEKASQRMATADALSLPADAKAKLIEVSREALAYDAAQGMVDLDARGFLERVGARAAKGAKGRQGSRDQSAEQMVASDPVLSSLSPEKLRATIDRASMIVSQQEAAAAAEAARRQAQADALQAKRERAANQAFTILTAFTLDGREPDPNSPSVKSHLEAIEGTPYAKAYREMLAEAPKRRAAAMQPIAVQEAELNSLMVRRNVQGTSKELEDEIKRREHVLASTKTDYAKEPLDAIVERGTWKITAPIDTTSIETIKAGIPLRLPQAEEASRMVSRPGEAPAPTSPLRAAEAHALAAKIQALPPAQQAAQVADLAAVMPHGAAQALAKQIAPKNRALSLMFAAGGAKGTSGALVAEHIANGATAIADMKGADVGEKGDGRRQALRRDIITYLDGKNPGEATITGQFRSDVIDAAIFIQAGLEKSGFRNADAETAVRLAIGGDMVTHNGKRIPLPVDGYDKLRDRLAAYPTEDLQRQAPDGKVLVAGRAIPLQQFMAELPQAILTPGDEEETYFVQSGAGLAMNTKGQRIKVRPR
jgi:hypothetical protein